MTENLYDRARELLCEVQSADHPVRLMAVTKTVPPERVNTAVAAGITLLGENRVQELLEKYESYEKGCEIHFIGSLQTNKVKYIVDKVDMIESVDSIRLAEEIEKRCAAIDKVMPILIEVNIAHEPQKGGVMPEDLPALLREIAALPHVSVRGLMTIGSLTATFEEKKAAFCQMSQLRLDIERENIHNISMQELSMGMSADYALAISCGATIVRVGSGLFGRRAPMHPSAAEK